MNLGELRTELSDRGFTYLSDARLNRYVNLGYTEVAEQATYPFALAEITGTSPVTVSDLRIVESVEDTTNGRKLVPIDRRSLTDQYNNLASTGAATYWYFTGQDTIATYPTDSNATLTVRYWKAPAELSFDSDEPIIPERYQYAIVDYAAARAYADNGEADRGFAARLEGDRLVQFMIQSLIDAQDDGPSHIVGGVGTDW